MMQFPLIAIGLGIAYAAAPGAVNTEAIRRGLAPVCCGSLPRNGWNTRFFLP
jgi:hypothetical protein